MAKITIVDEQDNVLYYKEREEVTLPEIRRITHVHVFNTQGDYLVARRHLSKKVHPGKWGPSVAGTVEEGETYESNAKKEAEEELGLSDLDIFFLEKSFYKASDGNRRFRGIFIAKSDTPVSELHLQETEVIDAKWVSVPELCEWFEKSPDDFLPSFDITINFLKQYAASHKS